jgi:hypothetical protein
VITLQLKSRVRMAALRLAELTSWVVLFSASQNATLRKPSASVLRGLLECKVRRGSSFEEDRDGRNQLWIHRCVSVMDEGGIGSSSKGWWPEGMCIPVGLGL